MPFMKTHAPYYQGLAIEYLQWEVSRMRRRLEKIARRCNISTLVPARKCPKCHGFGHWASECTTETLIVFTPDGRVIEVEEEQKPISGEDPYEEFEEPQLHADEEIPFPTPESQHVQFDDHTIELSGGPRFDSEFIDGQVPAEFVELQRQIDELLDGSLQSDQPALLSCPFEQQGVQGPDAEWVKELPQEEIAPNTPPKEEITKTRTSLLQIRADELSKGQLEIETIEMVLPPEIPRSETQILLGDDSQPHFEDKYLPTIAVPKVDLAWVKVKSKKVSMNSASKLGPVQILLHSFMDTPSRMMKTPPPARENDRVGPNPTSIAPLKFYTRRTAALEEEHHPAEPASPGGAEPAQTEPT